MMENESKKIRLEILGQAGQIKAQEEESGQAILVYNGIYEEGDRIRLACLQADCWYKIRLDDALDESLVYMTQEQLTFEIPFGEKKNSWNPKTFTGEIHYLTCRPAKEYEVKSYRNLAKNVIDQHGDNGCFPHASANVETRGESVFAARNAIDGVLANRSHGAWPYASWGINRRKDAQIRLEFGCPVDFDRIVLYTRADFPHDNWWVKAQLAFSDGSRETISMEKSEKGQEFLIARKGITWITLSDLIPSSDPSPFPALTQIEVYGTAAG